MKPEDFPSLKQYVGQDLVVTDGLTLLGGDDKAGVAEIMTAAEYLINHPEIPHGPIRVGFTPDEEVGQGADYFDVKKFGADFAYTVDGGECGELEYENFNAASVFVDFTGLSIHPGSAKNKMINALLLAMEFQGMMPEAQKPLFIWRLWRVLWNTHPANTLFETMILIYLRKKRNICRELPII